jgi:hypothetical protein
MDPGAFGSLAASLMHASLQTSTSELEYTVNE